MSRDVRLVDSYTETSTWVDGLIAVLLADRAVEERHDSQTDILVNAEAYIWYALRNKVNWEEALFYSPKWREYYPEMVLE